MFLFWEEASNEKKVMLLLGMAVAAVALYLSFDTFIASKPVKQALRTLRDLRLKQQVSSWFNPVRSFFGW